MVITDTLSFMAHFKMLVKDYRDYHDEEIMSYDYDLWNDGVLLNVFIRHVACEEPYIMVMHSPFDDGSDIEVIADSRVQPMQKVWDSFWTLYQHQLGQRRPT